MNKTNELEHTEAQTPHPVRPNTATVARNAQKSRIFSSKQADHHVLNLKQLNLKSKNEQFIFNSDSNNTLDGVKKSRYATSGREGT